MANFIVSLFCVLLQVCAQVAAELPIDSEEADEEKKRAKNTDKHPNSVLYVFGRGYAAKFCWGCSASKEIYSKVLLIVGEMKHKVMNVSKPCVCHSFTEKFLTPTPYGQKVVLLN
jgi:hypothetical protein